MTENREAENKGQRRCHCPYCDEEINLTAVPVCQSCSVALHYCITCNLPVDKEANVCPRCGGAIADAQS